MTTPTPSRYDSRRPWMGWIGDEQFRVQTALTAVEEQIYGSFDSYEDSKRAHENYDRQLILFDMILADDAKVEKIVADQVLTRLSIEIFSLVAPIEYAWMRQRRASAVEAIKTAAGRLTLVSLENDWPTPLGVIERRERQQAQLTKFFGETLRPSFAGTRRDPATTG